MLDDRDHRPEPPRDRDKARSADPLDELQARLAQLRAGGRPGAPRRELLLLLAAGLVALGWLLAALTDAGLRALVAAAQVLS